MEKVYKEYFLEILKKYKQGTATMEEINFLESYYDIFELDADLINEENEQDYLQVKYAIKNAADERIDQYSNSKRRWAGLRPVWVRYAAAAAILVSLSVSIYLIITPGNKHGLSEKAAKNILPGGNRATLTLANGTRIVLDNVHNGEIAKQSNVSITKTADNRIVYSANTGLTRQKATDQLRNKITTPNGGQFQLVLPDGTKVFLNATSSLSYPASFQGAERLVELNGEAYFEVAKNKNMPFRVKSGSQIVEVLGTHFNINSYEDEAFIKTTLVEGSVKVSSGANSTLIIPGQQSAISRARAGEIVKYTVDVDNEIAWKNGLFSFKNDDLRSIMRQIARWYDVKVVYADNLPNEKFIGEISRTSRLSDVFRILELNNVHFEVEGKTITVSAN